MNLGKWCQGQWKLHNFQDTLIFLRNTCYDPIYVNVKLCMMKQMHACGLFLQMLSKNDSNKEEEMKQQKGDSEDETEIEIEAAIQEVCSATGCSVSIECRFYASCSKLLDL